MPAKLALREEKTALREEKTALREEKTALREEKTALREEKTALRAGRLHASSYAQAPARKLLQEGRWVPACAG